MKKTRNKIIIFNILLVAIIVIFRNLALIDELFNYNFGRNIVSGNILYKDFNCIVFPTFPLIIAMFLKIFGQELIVYRILQLIIYIGIIIFSFRLLEKLNLSKVKNYIILVFYIALMAIYSIAEYNMFCLFIVLVILNLEEKLNCNKNFKYDLVIGILAGISITVKQSVGLLICACSIINVILQKEDIKNKLKSLFFRIISIIFILLLMFLYLIFNNNLNEWFDCTVLGLRNFSSNACSYFEWCITGNYFIVLLSIKIMLLKHDM